MGLKPSAMPTTGSGWCRPTSAPPEPCDPGTLPAGGLGRPHPTRRAPPAEVSRVRDRPAFAARCLSSGYPRVRDARGAGFTALLRDAGSATRASPQPDPLGHLMSRDRGAPGGEPDAVRPPPQTSWRGTPPTIPPRKPCSHVNERASGSRGPRRAPAFAGCKKPRTKGRFTRTPAKRYEIGCTRGAFHRRATRTWDTGLSPCIACRVGPSPQVVTNLWTTRGAVPSLAGPCSDPVALTGDRRRGLGLRGGWATENRPEPAR